MGILKTIGYIIAAIILIPIACVIISAFVLGIGEESTPTPELILTSEVAPTPTITITTTSDEDSRFMQICTEKNISLTTPTNTAPKATPTSQTSTNTITRTASQILPRCTEIGDGSGWLANYKINDAIGTSEGHYYKGDRTVIINVTISEDKNAAMVLYYDLYDQLGRDEYSPMEYGSNLVGDQSILRIYECPAGYGYNCIESGDGVFITDNVVVTVTVEDYHVTARDVSRYGGQMDI